MNQCSFPQLVYIRILIATLIDPQHSTAKRQQRTQAFTSQLAHASLERQLAALTTSKNDLEKKLREKDALVDRLEKDRRWLAEREQEEREEKERERIEWDEAKVCFLPHVRSEVVDGDYDYRENQITKFVLSEAL